jgi:hypothetical protein
MLNPKMSFLLNKPRPLFYWLAVFGINILIFFAYMVFAQKIDRFEPLQPMIDGSAARPYVYRVLAPILIDSFAKGLNISSEASCIMILYFSFIGFSLSFWYLATTFLQKRSAKTVTLFAPLSLIPLLVVQHHIYDLPTLFFFTLALALLAREKFMAFLAVFFLTCLSKETSLLLILFFGLHFRKIPIRKFLYLLDAQILIYAAVRFSLMWQFRNNPGSIVEFHFFDQLAGYQAQPFTAIILAMFVAFVLAISIYKIKEKPTFLRNAAITIGMPIAGLYIFFGMPFELRVFFEVAPVLYLLAVYPFAQPRSPLISQTN